MDAPRQYPNTHPMCFISTQCDQTFWTKIRPIRSENCPKWRPYLYKNILLKNVFGDLWVIFFLKNCAKKSSGDPTPKNIAQNGEILPNLVTLSPLVKLFLFVLID
jgi:hypothetical protein